MISVEAVRRTVQDLYAAGTETDARIAEAFQRLLSYERDLEREEVERHEQIMKEIDYDKGYY